jgi:hypothetical protein
VRNGYGGYNGMTPFAYSIDTDEAELIAIKTIKYIGHGSSPFRSKVLKAYFRDCRGEEYDPVEVDRRNAKLLDEGMRQVRRLQGRSIGGSWAAIVTRVLAPMGL